MADALIYRVGPHPGVSFYVPDASNNREGPQARKPSKSLKGQSYRERLAIKAMRGSIKDSDRAITPAAEAVHVPAHLAPPGSQQARQLRHLHAQLSLGQSCHRQKIIICAYVRTVALVVSLW